MEENSSQFFLKIDITTIARIAWENCLLYVCLPLCYHHWLQPPILLSICFSPIHLYLTARFKYFSSINPIRLKNTLKMPKLHFPSLQFPGNMVYYVMQRYLSGIKAVLPGLLHLLRFTLIWEAGRPWCWEPQRWFCSVFLSSPCRSSSTKLLTSVILNSP